MRCPGCGMPKHESWNPDSEGFYLPHTATCQGCAALKSHTEDEKEHHPERKHWLEDIRPPDQPLREWSPV